LDPQAEKSRERGALSVSALIDAFLEGHGAKLKPSSLVAYADWLAKVRAAHGTVKADALTRGQLTALHRSMSSTPYAANRVLAAASSLYAWAENQGLVLEGHANPAAKIQRCREQPRERFLTSEELARLGAALRVTKIDPFAVAAIRLLILTGGRLREILHARWEHVDFERGILFLPDSKTGKKPIFLMQRRSLSLRTCRASTATRIFSQARKTARRVSNWRNPGRSLGKPPDSTACGFMICAIHSPAWARGRRSASRSLAGCSAIRRRRRHNATRRAFIRFGPPRARRASQALSGRDSCGASWWLLPEPLTPNHP
jgi:integrase